MQIAITHLAILLSSAFLMALYYITLKKHPKQMLHLLFWSEFFSYLAFSTFFFVSNKSSYLFNFKHLEIFMYDFTYSNFPLYLMSGAATVGSLLILERLSKIVPIATFVAVSKVSILTSTIGYVLLGNTISTSALIGVTIVFLGALISGFPSFSIQHPTKLFKKISTELSPTLLKGAFLNAFFAFLSSMITFICTAKFNPITKDILQELTKHLHVIPFHTLNPIHFNISTQFAVTILLYCFIRFYRHHTGYVLQFLIDNPRDVAITALCFILSSFSYYYAFGVIIDKTLMSSLYKMYIPLTILLSFLILHKKPNSGQIVGATLIITGAFFAALF